MTGSSYGAYAIYSEWYKERYGSLVYTSYDDPGECIEVSLVFHTIREAIESTLPDKQYRGRVLARVGRVNRGRAPEPKEEHPQVCLIK